jgi:hypothetical protein
VHKLLLAVFTAAVMAFTATTGANAADSKLEFTVIRGGDEIGTHQISMTTSQQGRTQVDIATEVAVKLAFITVYNFDHEGHEVWENGKLVSYQSKTDDDGTDKALNARIDGNNLMVEGSARKAAVVQSIIPASLWNLATVTQTKLLNTLDGSEMAIAVKKMGEESLDIRGGKVAAQHYALTGDLEREVWYDPHGQLVKVRFLGSDGSEIQYVLK